MEFVLDLQAGSHLPLYRALAEAIKESIFSGRIRLGAPLPSVRELADSLSLSRTTVIRCYEELAGQGYIESIPRSGTFVSRNLPSERGLPALSEQEEFNAEPVRWSEYGERLMANAKVVRTLECMSEELNYGMPVTSDLPLQALSRYFRKYMRLDDTALTTYQADPLGLPFLREALADYLTRARGVRTSVDRLAVFSGSDHIVDIISRLLLNPGDGIAVENPSYPLPRRAFISYGAVIHPIDVDDQGLMVERLIEEDPPVKMVYVTPSHQDPRGPVLPVERRLKLLEWAASRGVLILEDDFDSEYRYSGKPVASIQGLDRNDNVIYFSSFWHTLGPIIRLGYLVVPQRMRENLGRAKNIVARDYPLVDQLALADFIKDGLFERHIHRTRSAYAKRRQALVFSLTTQLGKLVAVSRETAGMHLLVRFNEHIDESLIETCAYEAKVPIKSTGAYYLGEPLRGEYLISFAHAEETAIHDCVLRFAVALKQQLGFCQPMPVNAPIF